MNLDVVGTTARAVAPVVRQLVVAASPELAGNRDAFERKLYVDAPAGREDGRAGARHPELLVLAHARLQGDADRPRSSPTSTPTCATSA